MTKRQNSKLTLTEEQRKKLRVPRAPQTPPETDFPTDDQWDRLLPPVIGDFDDITSHHDFGIDMRRFEFHTPWNRKKEEVKVPEVVVIDDKPEVIVIDE